MKLYLSPLIALFLSWFFLGGPALALPNRISLAEQNLEYEILPDQVGSGRLVCFNYNGQTGLAFLKKHVLRLAKVRRAKLSKLIAKDSDVSSSAQERYKNQLRLLKGLKKRCKRGVVTNSNDSPVVFPTELLDLKNRFDSRMLRFGREHCRFISKDKSFDPSLAATFYDATWVFYQIADYTGDNYWTRCAENAAKVYRDQYVLANEGFIPGFWLFPHGLTESFIRTSNNKSRNALRLIQKNGAYARVSTALSETKHTDFSREVAYVILTYIEAEKLGITPPRRLEQLVDQALQHIQDWTTGSAPYVRPFMVSLTTQALIAYYDRTQDPRIPAAIKSALDYIWDNCWNAREKAFQYTDRERSDGGTELAPDLNLLIAPSFAWYYNISNNTTFYARAISVFSGGIEQAFLENPKQFNQNYRWSLQGIRWLNK